MLLSYDLVKDNSEAFRACTGLDRSEFETLLVAFTHAWHRHVEDTNIKSKARKRQYGGGRKATLGRIEDKLFFILFYFKTYPLQEVLALLFSLSQSQTNEWLHILSGVLKMALGEDHHLPERSPHDLETVLAECPQLEFVIDSTERRRQRPANPDEQKAHYSGKKKAHTYKNNVIVDANTQRVCYLSETYEGKKHDKKICDEEVYTFPTNSTLFKDTAFQGFEPDGVITFQPKKRFRGQQLTISDRILNAIISGVRMTVEHVICGVKRCRIVKDIFRNTKERFDDLVTEIACGLHNFRVACRRPPMSIDLARLFT
jgi:hypothetical protein